MLSPIKKSIFIMLALAIMTVGRLAYAADAIPEVLKNMTPAQLKAYLASGDSKASLKSLPKPPAAYTVENLIAWGKADLRGKNTVRALVFFEFATLKAPENQKARFWYGFTLLANNPEILKEMQARNLLDQDYNILPDRTISLPDILNFKKYQGLTAGLLEQTKAAKAHLNSIDVNFSEQIKDPAAGTIELDYAAVQAVKMFINLLEMKIYLINAYDTDFAQLTKKDLHYLTLIDLINFYPRLAAFKDATETELNSAKESLIAFIDSYMAMSEHLRKRDEIEGVGYAIRLYRSPEGKTISPQEYSAQRTKRLSEEAEVRQLLTNIKNNLVNPGAYPVVIVPDTSLFKNNPYAGIKLNLAAFFKGRDMRSHIKVIDTVLKKYGLIPNAFFDPSFEGLFPGATAWDLNYLLNKGPAIGNATYNTATKSAQISWGNPNSELLPFVIDMHIMRSTTPTFQSGSDTIMVHLPDFKKPFHSYVDNNLNPNVPVYYYRAYFTYRFNDGAIAYTYTQPAKLELISTVTNNQVPVIFSQLPKTVVRGQSLTFNVNAVDTDGDNVNFTAQLANGEPLSSIGASFIAKRMGNVTVGNFTWANVSYPQDSVVIVFSADDQKGGKTTSSLLIKVVAPAVIQSVTKPAAKPVSSSAIVKKTAVSAAKKK